MAERRSLDDAVGELVAQLNQIDVSTRAGDFDLQGCWIAALGSIIQLLENVAPQQSAMAHLDALRTSLMDLERGIASPSLQAGNRIRHSTPPKTYAETKIEAEAIYAMELLKAPDTTFPAAARQVVRHLAVATNGQRKITARTLEDLRNNDLKTDKSVGGLVRRFWYRACARIYPRATSVEGRRATALRMMGRWPVEYFYSFSPGFKERAYDEDELKTFATAVALLAERAGEETKVAVQAVCDLWDNAFSKHGNAAPSLKNHELKARCIAADADTLLKSLALAPERALILGKEAPMVSFFSAARTLEVKILATTLPSPP